MINNIILRRRALLATPAIVDPFVDGLHMTVDTTIAGDTGVGKLFLATRAGFSFNFDVDWGDGQVNSGLTASITHTYATPGIYLIRIKGIFPIVSVSLFFTGNDQLKYKYLNQWGNIAFSSFDQSFRSTSIALKTNEAPTIVGANVSFNRAFNGANKWFTAGFGVNAWDMSKVSNMFACFFSINGGLGDNRWDLWNVTSLTNADAFTQDTALDKFKYDLMLNSYANQALKPNVIFDVGLTKYTSAGASARQFIIDTYGWTFQDGGLFT